MAKNDINKTEFSEETKLKLSLFRECFREWFPVFVHNPFITHIYVYDMFAGSGKDAANNPGSPLILLQESRGDNKQHCKSLLKTNAPGVVFAFNELDSDKRAELEKNVFEEYSACKQLCKEKKCPFTNSFHYADVDFSTLIKNDRLTTILSSNKYAKFILLDQYGFKQINDDVFLKLVNSPNTDFIFFIASSFVKRFKDLPAVTTYFDINKIRYDETQPKECHKAITDYFRNIIPSGKKYFLHSFTIQKGSNYYGLIFGSNHSLGMEKFVKVCWRHDKQAGESNCNLYNDYEEGTLFYNTVNTNKKDLIRQKIQEKILNSQINDNISGLEYALQNGCEPKLFVEVIKQLQSQNKVKIVGEFNSQSTNIHKVKKYGIIVV